MQKQLIIFLILRLLAGITRTAHAGSTVESLHLKAGIISNARHAKLFRIIDSLLACIRSKGAACFRRRLHSSKICQIFYFDGQLLQQSLKFLHLALIMGCNN